MDSITQILLGSALGAAVADKGSRRRAILAGAVLGTLPDLDVLVRYSSPVDSITAHRSFTHSLIVLIPFSLLIMPLLKWFFLSMSWWRVGLLSLLCLTTHPLLDALTSYGTQLFWPLSTPPIAIASVYIIDPIYSIFLLLGLLMIYCSPRLAWANYLGLLISTFYLLIGVILQGQAKSSFRQYLATNQSTYFAKGGTDSHWFITPYTGSPFCWRAIKIQDSRYLEMQLNVINPTAVTVDAYNIITPEQWPINKSLSQLKWFSRGFNVLRESHDKQNWISSDLRMGSSGNYVFEFILSKENEPTKLRTDKLAWQPIARNTLAKNNAEKYQGMGIVEQKLKQMRSCLQGEL